MDFASERYVRLYVRDTITWTALGWQGQTVLALTLRKLDRSGVLEIGGRDPAQAIAMTTGLPVEIVEIGLPRLIAEEVLEMGDRTLVMPKYLDAQEAVQTDAHRAREYRSRMRDKARTSRNVTDASRNVTETSRGVTRRHAASLLAVPSRTKELESPTEILVPHGTNGVEPEASPPGEEKPISPEELMDTWNEVCQPLGLPVVKEVRGSRRQRVMARLREHPKVEFWQSVFASIRRSAFLQGRSKPANGHPNWRASFDWLVQNDVNCVKVTEGRYGEG